jgi:hypothetical protein
LCAPSPPTCLGEHSGRWAGSVDKGEELPVAAFSTTSHNGSKAEVANPQIGYAAETSGIILNDTNGCRGFNLRDDYCRSADSNILASAFCVLSGKGPLAKSKDLKRLGALQTGSSHRCHTGIRLLPYRSQSRASRRDAGRRVGAERSFVFDRRSPRRTVLPFASRQTMVCGRMLR